MKGVFVALTVLVLVSLACAPFAVPARPSDDIIATRVAEILTEVPPEQPTPTVIAPAIEDPQTPTAAATPDQPEPTPTLEASPTPVPTLTPTPAATITPPASDPRATLGNPTWRDDFSHGRNWVLSRDDYTAARVIDGQMVLTGLSAIDGWRITWRQVEDYYLEMTVKPGDCHGGDQYGLFVRISADQLDPHRGYLYAFTCDGRYSLRRWDGRQMSMTWLVPLTASTSIRSGAGVDNRMGIMLTDKRLTLYANGVLLKEVHDDVFTDKYPQSGHKGRFGVFVGAKETEDFTIYIDEIAYWENP